MMNIVSLGAGVQSTTMALMAAHGEITPMPDCAIFADTGSEPKAVYEHLDWLCSPNVLPFEVVRVSAGAIFENIKAGARGERWAALPTFTSEPFMHGASGKLPRQCTQDFKLAPLSAEMRRRAGLAKGQRSKGVAVAAWIGISTDEIVRATPSRMPWQAKRFPLIELGMSRWDCLQWMSRKGYPQPPKSSCTFCPYHSDTAWRELRDNDPEGWSEALAADELLRTGKFRGMRAPMFLHRSCVPLADVDLRSDEDRGQMNLFALNDCVGICGV